jgi:hypothetical protein
MDLTRSKYFTGRLSGGTVYAATMSSVKAVATVERDFRPFGVSGRVIKEIMS